MPDENIITYGEYATTFYIILSGRANIYLKTITNFKLNDVDYIMFLVKNQNFILNINGKKFRMIRDFIQEITRNSELSKICWTYLNSEWSSILR